MRRVFDGLDVIQERNSANEVTAQYTRDGNIGGILARASASGRSYFHYDGGGNVTALSDENGNLVGRYSYDAFGNTLEASGPRAQENPYRFSTKEWHAASGMVDYGFRFYSPGMGRWLNRDPIREDGGINLYGFVENDPVNASDEYGLSTLSKADCLTLLATIMTKDGLLQKEFAKYNPNLDGKGGPNWTPGGHYEKIKNMQDRQKPDVDKYLKECGNNCRNGKTPELDNGIEERAKRMVKKPRIRTRKGGSLLKKRGRWVAGRIAKSAGKKVPVVGWAWTGWEVYRTWRDPKASWTDVAGSVF